MVGATIATKLIELGQEVMVGSRNAGSEKAVTWAQANGANASQGAYAQAARFGEIIFNCTQGTASIEALQSAGADNLKGFRQSAEFRPFLIAVQPFVGDIEEMRHYEVTRVRRRGGRGVVNE